MRALRLCATHTILNTPVAVPLVALLCKRPYGTGLSVAVAALYPSSCSSLRRASGYALRTKFSRET